MRPGLLLKFQDPRRSHYAPTGKNFNRLNIGYKLEFAKVIDVKSPLRLLGWVITSGKA